VIDRLPRATSRTSHAEAERTNALSYFYEIRSADNTVLKCDGGFAWQGLAE